jgi:predicted nucleic acid-binding protein
MSPAGRAVVQAEMTAERDRSRAHAARLRVALERLERETQRNPMDLQALQEALEARDMIEMERIRENSRTAIALMGKLSPADRLIAAQALRGIGQAPQRAVTRPIVPPRP